MDEIELNHPVAVMRFTLVYRGRLPSPTRHDGCVFEKQAIRREFHGQLRALWEDHPALKKDWDEWQEMPEATRERVMSGDARMLPSDYRFFHPQRRGAFAFVPLVISRLWLTCELDVLFLRADLPGSIFTGTHAGDLDNRLKVLFDALRLPKGPDELPAGDVPAANEAPFFCLLEDDALITAVRVEAETLLANATRRDDVQLVVRVTVKARKLSSRSLEISE